MTACFVQCEGKKMQDPIRTLRARLRSEQRPAPLPVRGMAFDTDTPPAMADMPRLQDPSKFRKAFSKKLHSR